MKYILCEGSGAVGHQLRIEPSGRVVMCVMCGGQLLANEHHEAPEHTRRDILSAIETDCFQMIPHRSARDHHCDCVCVLPRNHKGRHFCAWDLADGGS